MEVRVPRPLVEALERAAANEARDVNDWVVALIAERLGHPLTRQEQLPLNEAA